MTATFDDVRRIGLALAEVTESTSYGTPSLKVNGKSLCRQWSDREHDRDGIHDTEVLVVFCELDVKDALIEASEGVLFSTTHYHDYGAMLIRLADVEPDDLADWLEDSYRLRAPTRLLRMLDTLEPDRP